MNTSINYFNIDIDNVEKCAICQGPLCAEQTYTLPECQRIFHTDCIITWFRNTKDPDCPYCRNMGINQCSQQQRRHLGWLSIKDKQRLADLRAYSRRRDANPIVVQKFKNLTKLKNDFNLFKKKFGDFNNSLKSKTCADYDDLSIIDVSKIAKKWKKQKRDHIEKIRRAEIAILGLNIIPLIIPRFIDIS